MAAHAQTYTTLFNFDGSNGDGPAYMSLAQGTDGELYGTTLGFNGTVFKITTTGTLTQLHHFNGTDGSSLTAGVVLARDGNFYGATGGGGSGNAGTVFRITPTGTLTTLHNFTGTDGAGPGTLVQGTDGNFYGITGGGGTSNDGTVFKMTPQGTVTSLHSFSGTDGSQVFSFRAGYPGDHIGEALGVRRQRNARLGRARYLIVRKKQ